jgi:hypothetical protein
MIGNNHHFLNFVISNHFYQKNLVLLEITFVLILTYRKLHQSRFLPLPDWWEKLG